MKKKLAAVMLSLALIAGLIPGMALAAGDESGEQGEKAISFTFPRTVQATGKLCRRPPP